MPHILPGAAYVQMQHRKADPRAGDAGRDRIWELLATPQTVESLCRSLGKQDVAGKDCRTYVTEVLGDFYDEECIEVSPDT